jgi:small acid-soluble spore protein P (minor)
MPKDKAQPTNFENGINERNQNNREKNVNEPLSGSKKVKNRQHSRDNHGEGS